MNHARRGIGTAVIIASNCRTSIASKPLRVTRWYTISRALAQSGAIIHRLSKSWIPTLAKTKSTTGTEDSHSLLIRGGFLRQTHAGIFHLLPLGQRVQSKLENVIDHHMESVGASEVSLSSISSEALWRQSGRLEGKDSELFRFKDRKDTKLLLSPTHEEEITSIVSGSVQSHKDLPLRLYQISRKYRDEQRPRQGLLRGREFLMKDLYTFDASEEASRTTYEEVRSAYERIFKQLTVPFLTAAADSGSMGGKISHEYHYPSPDGEDNIIQCSNCRETRNDEVAVTRTAIEEKDMIQDRNDIHPQYVATVDGKTLIHVWLPNKVSNTASPRPPTLNLNAVKAALPDLDVKKELVINYTDSRIYDRSIFLLDPRVSPRLLEGAGFEVRQAEIDGIPLSLTTVLPGDLCISCGEGRVNVIKAIEVGHTFNLGTRYSKPLKLQVRTSTNELVDVQMGCHGIGVSRLIAAIASVKADDKGLNWPAVIAPYSVLVIPLKDREDDSIRAATSIQAAIEEGWNGLAKFMPDVAVDDRNKAVGWKLRDAELIGYPIVVVVGDGYSKSNTVEVHCRQLGLKEKEVILDATTLQDIFVALETKGTASVS
ncbi:hypothetical protein BDZ85DRAFT_262592 [Elsinoe ampelina]|uniref:proline--tRNA ligase n=1 Tax=Elsinoe ampelina TaxID=302913 RepID=A0A6A6GBX6_9PEZI|nr:hypothetical protein BDZ85DRAFT_262592 [Elsinoe ampelina]